MAKNTALSSDEIEIILSKKYSSKELSVLLGNSQSHIIRTARKYNLKLPRSTVNKSKKYSCNEEFFDSWGAEMAYLLGFIYADGNISLSKKSEPYRLTFSICEKDVELLHKIKSILKSTNPLKLTNSKLNGKNYPQYVLCINSHKLCSTLFSLGVINNKSLKLNWPQSLPDQYINHFVRGYFDGDGTFCTRSDNTKNKIVCILGTKVFLEELKKNFSKIYKKEIGSISKHNKGKIYKYYLHGPSAVEFLKWIYSDSTEESRMSRKYNKFCEI